MGWSQAQLIITSLWPKNLCSKLTNDDFLMSFGYVSLIQTAKCYPKNHHVGVYE